MTSTTDQGHESYGDINRDNLATSLRNAYVNSPQWPNAWRDVADTAIEELIEDPKPPARVAVAILDRTHLDAEFPVVIVADSTDRLWEILTETYGLPGMDDDDVLELLTLKEQYVVTTDEYEVRTSK